MITLLSCVIHILSGENYCDNNSSSCAYSITHARIQIVHNKSYHKFLTLTLMCLKNLMFKNKVLIFNNPDKSKVFKNVLGLNTNFWGKK